MIRAVIVAASAKPPKLVTARLERVRAAGLALQEAWIAVNRPAESGVSLRELDLRDDRDWRLLRERMLHWAEIDHRQYGPRAIEIDALLFPTGLDFLALKYEEQWSECERRLELIETDGLEHELEHMIHAEFLAELRDAHASYGEALGITSKKDPVPDATRVIDALRAARKALAAYARVVYTLAEDDEDAVAVAEGALEPILRFRVRRGSLSQLERKNSPVCLKLYRDFLKISSRFASRCGTPCTTACRTGERRSRICSRRSRTTTSKPGIRSRTCLTG